MRCTWVNRPIEDRYVEYCRMMGSIYEDCEEKINAGNHMISSGKLDGDENIYKKANYLRILKGLHDDQEDSVISTVKYINRHQIAHDVALAEAGKYDSFEGKSFFQTLRYELGKVV